MITNLKGNGNWCTFSIHKCTFAYFSGLRKNTKVQLYQLLQAEDSGKDSIIFPFFNKIFFAFAKDWFHNRNCKKEVIFSEGL